MIKLCTKCHKYPAVVPDRNKLGSMVKSICRKCHAERLAGDLQRIFGNGTTGS